MKLLFYHFILLFSSLPLGFCAEIKILENEPKDTMNVVIFFTHVDGKCSTLQKNTLEFLNLHETTRVKLSVDQQDSAFQDENKTGSEFCSDFLKDSLMSLTHFCHTVMKMKTAIASVSSKEMMNDIQEPDAQFHTPGIHIDPDSRSRFSRSENSQLGLDRQSPYSDRPPVSENEAFKSSTKNIITGSKHTEVFQIRVKRNVGVKQQGEPAGEKKINVKVIDDYPPEKKPRDHPSWDVLDIMKHVRYSFLGDMFEDAKDQMQKDQDDLVDISQVGKEKQDPGLFSTVKSTLDSLLDTPEANFLMVIFGGHLHTIIDPHSAIVQSIKHVIENTDNENTLIVVTGSCASDLSGENDSAYTMPVYATGPKHEILSECNLLYDIPLIIRKVMEIHSGAGLHFPDEAST